jgi:tetratricopeptide (TPR) repeat protein
VIKGSDLNMVNKEIRVFLSSTFDLHDLRDSFRNEISARLNNIVGKLGMNIYLYDYEMGIPYITRETADELKNKYAQVVLHTIVSAICKCDYFIFILSGSYGSCVKSIIGYEEYRKNGIESDLKQMGIDKSFLSVIDKNPSVLEIELQLSIMLHKPCIFCIDSDVRFSNQPELLSSLYEFVIVQSKKSHNALVNFSRHLSKIPEIGNEIEDYFKSIFNTDIEAISEDEQNKNLLYANRLRYYTPNYKGISLIEEYISNDIQQCCYLYGESGSGKSTLLVDWIGNRKYVISYFVGTVGDTLSSMLSSLYEDNWPNAPFDLGADEIKLSTRFYDFLAANKGKTIVLDGLDQIIIENGIQRYWWLPVQLPEGVKLIFTTTDKLEGNYYTIRIPIVSTEHVVKKYLELVGKELEFSKFERLISHINIKCNFPLAARILCREIIARIGNKTKFSDRSDELFSVIIDAQEHSDSLPSIYGYFLQRIERLFDFNLVAEVLGMLYISKYGIKPKILNFSNPYEINDLLNIMYDDFLKDRHGNLRIMHEYMLEAIFNKYFSPEANKSKYRKTLTTALNVYGDIDDSLELAYQIYSLNDKSMMKSLILNIPKLMEILEKSKLDMVQYTSILTSDELKDILIKVELHSVNSFYKLGLYCILMGIYDIAMLFLERAIESENILANNKPDLPTLYNEIATICQYQGNYQKALEWYEKAKILRESKVGKTHADTAELYGNIGTVYYDLSEYKNALLWHKRASAIKENLLGFENPETAITYNNIACTFQALGQYPSALEFYNKALEIVKKIYGSSHLLITTKYNNIGSLYKLQGMFEEALKWFYQDLEINEKVLGQFHPNLVTTYSNIASIYESKANYKLAFEMLEKAKKISEKVLGMYHPITATVYNNIANIFECIGDYDEALKWYKRDLDINEQAFKINHVNIITTLNNIAVTYRQKGNFSESEKLLTRARAISEETFGCIHPITATVYNNIADIYSENADYDRALHMFKQSLYISENVSGSEHPDIGKAYNNIAVVYIKQGKYPEALKLYRTSLTIIKKSLGKEHPMIATLYNNIAVAYQNLGIYSYSFKYCRKSLLIYKNIYEQEHPDIANVYSNIAGILVRKKNYKEALKWYQKSFQQLNNILGNEHPDITNLDYIVLCLEKIIQKQNQ